MDRKEITAYLIGCKSDEFMAYADQAEAGTVVVGPDGKKYRFSVDQLEKTEVLMNDKFMQTTLADVVSSSAAKETASPAPKRPARPGTRKTAAKPKQKPPKKSGSAPKTA